jgi:hypothetical protein
MPTKEDERLKELLIGEIERDEQRAQRHRKVLAELEPRLRGARAYLVARFGEDALPDHLRAEARRVSTVLAEPARKRKRFGHADLCAIAVTEAGMVGEPVTVDRVRKLLIEAAFATAGYPTRQTLVSTLNRSPLFETQGGGHFKLLRPYTRADVPEKHRYKLDTFRKAGVSAGNEETEPGTRGKTQGSEAGTPATAITS